MLHFWRLVLFFIFGPIQLCPVLKLLTRRRSFGPHSIFGQSSNIHWDIIGWSWAIILSFWPYLRSFWYKSLRQVVGIHFTETKNYNHPLRQSSKSWQISPHPSPRWFALHGIALPFWQENSAGECGGQNNYNNSSTKSNNGNNKHDDTDDDDLSSSKNWVQTFWIPPPQGRLTMQISYVIGPLWHVMLWVSPC